MRWQARWQAVDFVRIALQSSVQSADRWEDFLLWESALGAIAASGMRSRVAHQQTDAEGDLAQVEDLQGGKSHQVEVVYDYAAVETVFSEKEAVTQN